MRDRCKWLLLATPLTLATSCIDVSGFSCSDDAACDHRSDAVCLDGHCARPDETCEGGYRFDVQAAASVAGTCAPARGTTSSSTETSTVASATGSPTSLDPATSEASSSSSSTSASTSAGPPATTTSTTAGSSTSGEPSCGHDPCPCTIDLSAGSWHNCIVRADGSVTCWGRNEFGQLGQPATETAIAWPQPIALPDVASAVSTYRTTACALLDDGDVHCWGSNEAGAIDPLGDTEAGVVLGPTKVDGVSNVERLEVGNLFSCALGADQRFTCWGINTARQLMLVGDGPTVHTSGPYLQGAVVDFALGNNFGCMWSLAELACWGRNSHGQIGSGDVGTSYETPQVVPLGATPQFVHVGRYHVCAASNADGQIRCWGDNVSAQIGPPEAPDTTTPVALDFDWPGSLIALGGGQLTTCGLFDSGELICWGGTQGTTLGTSIPNQEPMWPPLPLPPFEEIPGAIEGLDGGINHVCARTDAQNLWCWGSDTHFQVGGIAPRPGMTATEVDVECRR